MASQSETNDIDPYLSKSVSTLDNPPPANYEHQQEDLFQYTVNKVRENPVLALGAVAVVGAIAALALAPRRSQARSLERRVSRQLAAVEKNLRNAVNRSGVGSSLSDLTDRIASQLGRLDAPQYAHLQQRAIDALQSAASRVSSAIK